MTEFCPTGELRGIEARTLLGSCGHWGSLATTSCKLGTEAAKALRSLANLVVRNSATIQHAAQLVERAQQIDIGNINVPVLVRLQHCSKPVPLRDGLPFRRDNSPARFNGRHTLAGLTATTSWSSIMNVSRR
jgi:Flp pilus assembly CpaF family ATPase